MSLQGNVCPLGVIGLFARNTNRQDTYPQTKHSDPELQPKTPMCLIRAREAATQVHKVSGYLQRQNGKLARTPEPRVSGSTWQDLFKDRRENLFAQERHFWVSPFFIFLLSFQSDKYPNAFVCFRRRWEIGRTSWKAVETDSILTRLFFLAISLSLFFLIISFHFDRFSPSWPSPDESPCRPDRWDCKALKN